MSRPQTHFVALLLLSALSPLRAAEYYVSPTGDDAHAGTLEQPFASIARARDAARRVNSEPVRIYLRAGTYYLDQPLVLGSADSRTAAAPLSIEAYAGETPVVSGGQRLELDWKPYRNGIMQAAVPAGFRSDQLFIDGQRQHMARYPNFDAQAQYFNGAAADCISSQRAAHWQNPSGGFFHAMHNSHWGDMHYVIQGKNPDGSLQYEGGWQNNRKSQPHAEHRFVENIFEELDVPGEWFHDPGRDVLYLMPPAGVKLPEAKVESVRLDQLFEFRGSETRPVRFITLRGLTLTHTARTFMENREPLLRSDWTTWRGGAIFFDGAEDCRLLELIILQVGSNAVFVNNYNRRIGVSGCQITDSGASSISFVGNPAALRSPLFNYHQTNELDAMDRVPGPQSNDLPRDCLVDNCLLTRNGRFEKQTAGVNICMAAEITVKHCSIYDVPRAGINICDGAFGGHLIEHCDVFDTVKETGDHGSFNSWGRDRFWHPDREQTERWLVEHPQMAKWDAQKTTVIRHNRWRCDLGWDIDLDDGSSNYHIYNNLCLSGGIKLREGYHRLVENNVLVNNTLHPHVWYPESDSAFRRNIVFAPYAPAGMKPDHYGQQIEGNFLHTEDGGRTQPASALQTVSGADTNSKTGNAMFVAPAECDYQVRAGSPARQSGFKNFPMAGFGVTSERLKELARRPVFPGSTAEARIVNRGWGQAQVLSPHKKSQKTLWKGAVIKNVQTTGEQSAAGLDSIRGVLILAVEPASDAAQLGLQEGDVILECDAAVKDVRSFLDQFERSGVVKLWRDQAEFQLKFGRPAGSD